MQRSRRQVRFWTALICGLTMGACKREPASSPKPPPVQLRAPDRDEIPPDQLALVIAAHYQGLGAMERYEYAQAARAFREVHTRAPGWTIGTINLAIALLNQGGEVAEKAKTSGQDQEQEATLNLDTARKLLDEVLVKQPDQLNALFSRAIILRSQGDLPAAHRDFARVAQLDPNDAHTWLEFGLTLTDPDRAGMPAGRKQAPELISAYTKALQANPYLVPALYNLGLAHAKAGDRLNGEKLMMSYRKLDPKGMNNAAAAGEPAQVIYGEMGKYAQIINPFPRPNQATSPVPGPRFGSDELTEINLDAGDRWAVAADFVGTTAAIGRAQARFGAGMATWDVNRDGKLDLYLTAAVVGPLGLRDSLLVNLGDGKFADRTAAYGLPLDRAGLGVAVGDFDADFQMDLFLTGINNNRLFRQEGSKFQDVTLMSGAVVADAISLTARWFDIDQDGDLDLYVINYAPVSELEVVFQPGKSGSGMANAVFRNDGRPAAIESRPEDNLAPLAVATPDLPAVRGLSIAFSTAWPSRDVLSAGQGRHTGFAALDIDDDRDFDYVITADGQPPQVLLNDRGGQFHIGQLQGWKPKGDVSGVLVTDVDRNGQADLVGTVEGDRVFAWRNMTRRLDSGSEIVGESVPIDSRGWRSAVTADLDLDSWSDLVGMSGVAATPGINWARNEANRFANRLLPTTPLDGRVRTFAAFTLADLVGDPLPDLIVRLDGEAPRVARNLGNGSHWLAVDLAGRWKTSHDQMRTNSEGLGARLALEGQGLYVPFDVTTPAAGLAQSVGPFVLGLGSNLSAPLLRVRWPDGVMQAELNVTADKTLNLVELSRKTGSCPILFTWNGERFVCLGDFAGAAGLGFLEAPGLYHPPDRDESMAINPDQLREVTGSYRLSVVEPMDEVAYLDQITLDVVDRPPGITTTSDERFALGASMPTGQLLAWTKTIAPLAARDRSGRDLLDLVAQADRRTVDQFSRINEWIGYTEDHDLILDFGDLLSRIKPGDEPVLCLTGWVEYPYSQTNYAAATAGVSLQAPVLAHRLANGTWQMIDQEMGHPAGLTRMMTLNLAGKLLPEERCVLRISTNMECYWDQAFIAFKNSADLDSVRVTSLPVANARLRDRGYLRESSPDGLKPILPNYDQVDPAPLARLRGELTRHGDVAPLLRADDDQLCVMGPGDEVELEFTATGLPPLPAGWTRSFVFRSVAYCKDADPFTATSDSVGPLPWRGMKSFPFPPGGERPVDSAYHAYLREYQTRPAGAR